MTLKQLLESIEFQGFIYIRVFDYVQVQYTETIATVDARHERLTKYGDFSVTHIYNYSDGVAIEITNNY